MENKNPTSAKRISLIVTADLATGHVEVRGPLAHKALCVKALSTAIQIVVDHVPPVIQAPIAPQIVPAQNGTTN